VREASVRGRLHELSFGFPALVVPESDVQATGTADYLADVEKQNRALSDPRVSSSEWDTIYGELMIFADPDERLVAFDALEGYVSGEESLHERALSQLRSPVRSSSRELTGSGGPLVSICRAGTGPHLNSPEIGRVLRFLRRAPYRRRARA